MASWRFAKLNGTPVYLLRSAFLQTKLVTLRRWLPIDAPFAAREAGTTGNYLSISVRALPGSGAVVAELPDVLSDVLPAVAPDDNALDADHS